jgi:hypothetical protein
MQAKEKWMDETMDALNGINRAESNPALLEKVMQSIHPDQPELIGGQIGLIWKFAACIALLISFNLITLKQIDRSASADQNSAKSAASEYFSYIDYYNL